MFGKEAYSMETVNSHIYGLETTNVSMTPIMFLQGHATATLLETLKVPQVKSVRVPSF